YNLYCTMGRMITREMVYQQLATVMDPELHVNIVDLGLIYDVIIKPQIPNHKQNGVIIVKMTLTTPGCPLAPVIDQLIKEALKPLRAKKIELKLVWEPAWNRDMMSEESRLQLGMV
ncbi:MAG: Metal-sulfur cluster biosynthetic enzyme, partial [uncultured bacterium]